MSKNLEAALEDAYTRKLHTHGELYTKSFFIPLSVTTHTRRRSKTNTAISVYKRRGERVCCPTIQKSIGFLFSKIKCKILNFSCDCLKLRNQLYIVQNTFQQSKTINTKKKYAQQTQ